jgi:hypothetical protein
MADQISKSALQALAAVGFLYLTYRVSNFVRLLASLFILPGASVRLVPARFLLPTDSLAALQIRS